MANVYDVGQYITELVPTVDTMKLYKLFPKGGSSLGPVTYCSRNHYRHGRTVLSLLLCAIETSQAATPQT